VELWDHASTCKTRNVWVFIMKESRIAADRGGRASYPARSRFDPIVALTLESIVGDSQTHDQKRLVVEKW
jgi:hypothetical protein